MLPIAEIQESIYQTLKPALQPVPVLDDAGPDQIFPYVTIGEFIGAPADTLGEAGFDTELTIHTWSRQRGMLETSILMRKVWDTLHRQTLPASTFQWVDTICNYAQTLREPDGKTRHGVIRVRIMTFES